MTRSNESIRAGSAEGAALGFGPSLMARLGLSGVYHGICVGYRSIYEAEYLKEWPRLQAMRAKRDRLIRYAPLMFLPLFDRFLRELDQFEQYMRSLTEVKWVDDAHNVVTTVGANLALDTILAGSSYTVTGPYMFLIGAVSYSSVPVIGDTMSSHATWTEAGGTNAPTYSGNRPTVAWSSAASKSKAPSSAPVFTITGTGTAKGVGLVYGSGASATKDNTSGVLYSAGLFSGGDQAVVNTNTLTITYTATA